MTDAGGMEWPGEGGGAHSGLQLDDGVQRTANFGDHRGARRRSACQPHPRGVAARSPERVRRGEREAVAGKAGVILGSVVAVAEEFNLELAMPPDDPPVSPIRGIGRMRPQAISCFFRGR